MLNPSRIIFLLVCTVVGAIAAYLFGLRGPIVSEVSHVAKVSHVAETGVVEELSDTQLQTNDLSADAGFPKQPPPTQTKLEPPIWNQEETVADSAVFDAPSFRLPAGGTQPLDADRLYPTDDVQLQTVPVSGPESPDATHYQSVNTADYVIPADDRGHVRGGFQSSVDTNTDGDDWSRRDPGTPPNPFPRVEGAGPLRMKMNSAFRGKVNATENDAPYVVYNANGSRPLLTLKIGRPESSRLSAAEMRRPEPIRPALPTIRESLPQSSLYLEVNVNTRTCDIKAQHVKLRDLLAALGERSGVWIAPTQHVGGLVSANIQDRRLEEAIEEIISPLGYSVGVRDEAILVGLHDEVSGYERRLRDFEQFHKARVATHETALVQHEGRKAESLPRSSREDIAMRRSPTQPLQGRLDSRGQGAIALVSHSEVYREPANLVPGRASMKFLPSQDQHGDTQARNDNALPMHAGPPRAPSTEAVLESRRIKIAQEEDNVISVIAERALNQIKAGRNRRAVNMLSQLVTEHRNSAQLFQLLGEAYYHCEQYDAAEVSLNHSLQLYKNDARANYFLGCVLAKLGDRQRSLHYLLQAHDIDPMYPPVVSEAALAPR